MDNHKSKMKQELTIEEIEREQEDLDLKQEDLDLKKEQLGLGIDTGMTEDEKFTTQLIAERDKKIKVGLGTMIMGRILFGKFGGKR